jgi:hypothetical protein
MLRAALGRTAEGGCPYVFLTKFHLFRTKEKGEIRSSPLVSIDCFVRLLLLVQFDRVAGINIFQSEDDHGGR